MRTDVTMIGRTAMPTPWRLDDYNPYEYTFEEGLLAELSEQDRDVDSLVRALHEIAKAPAQAETRIIDGTRVYVRKIDTASKDGKRGPSLLIAYVLQHDKALIRPLLICRSDDALADDVLRSVLEGSSEHEEVVTRPVLFPVEPPDIPAESLERAMQRALKRSK